jgi:Tfp pilus assembly protein PilF
MAEEILETRSRALKKVIALLGNPGADFRLDLYLYLDGETKERLTGVKVESHSVPGAGEMHMTVRMANSSSIHEDVHPVAEAVLGTTTSTPLYVGLAYALDPVLLREPLSYHMALMMDRNRVPAIPDLLDEERFRKLPNAERLASAGMFMTWLREIVSLRKISAWYTSPEPSLESLAAELGTVPAKLEKNYRQWLDDRVKPHSADVLFMKALNEAKNYHLTGEQEKAAEALARALSHKPEDRQARFNLATARMKTGAYEKAAAELRKVIESGAGGTGGLTVHAHLQLARVYDLIGRREEALAEYRLVLEMPNRYDSHLSAREGIETPYTADRL